MKNKKDAHNFFNTKKQIKHYDDIYNEKPNFKLDYPANRKRLEITIKKLKIIKPKNILDSGCGNGLPLIKIKKKGFNIEGFDKSKNMVLAAKENLKKNKMNPDLVFNWDFSKKIKNKKYDCIIGLGAFYYTNNFNKVLKVQSSMLKKNGHMIFSCRNELFNAFSMNHYSTKFLEDFYEIKTYGKKINQKFKSYFKGYKLNHTAFQKNIDQNKVKNAIHNPLTIEEIYLKKNKLKLEKIDYYHFHCLPPSLEIDLGVNFRKISWNMEKSNNWRGIFMASGFVITCKKF